MKFLIKATHTEQMKKALDDFENEFNDNFDSAVEEHPLAKKTKFKSPITVRITIYEVKEGYDLIINLNIPKIMAMALSIKGVFKRSIEEYLDKCNVKYESVKFVTGGM
jgi:hypothetical protein